MSPPFNSGLLVPIPDNYCNRNLTASFVEAGKGVASNAPPSDNLDAVFVSHTVQIAVYMTVQ